MRGGRRLTEEAIDEFESPGVEEAESDEASGLRRLENPKLAGGGMERGRSRR
jgi:hypothetical protein